MPAYTVVAAAIIRDGRLLAAQRAYPAALAGRWELPGGKVEPGETEVEALVRECREELGVTVTISDRIGPDVATVDGAGILRTWRAEIVDGLEPEPAEHRSLLWLSAGRLDDVDWLDADRPVLDHLRRLLHE